jgi:hypothetical protein
MPGTPMSIHGLHSLRIILSALPKFKISIRLKQSGLRMNNIVIPTPIVCSRLVTISTLMAFANLKSHKMAYSYGTSQNLLSLQKIYDLALS